MDDPTPVDPGRELATCDRFVCTLMVCRCLERHVAVWPSGMRRGTPRFPPCARCSVGAERLAAAPWFVPPVPSQPAEVLSPSQRAAKARYLATTMLEQVGPDRSDDPLAVAADLTPDDRGLDAA